MPNDTFLMTVATVAIYVVVLWLPGGLAAAAAGLRGWALAATAPLLTYTVAGLAGPWLSIAGLRYDLLSFSVCALVFVLLLGLLRWLSARRRPAEREASPWTGRAHLAVLLTVLASFAVGVAVLMYAMHGNLNAVPQDWDAGYHANGVRYIAETGDGSLYGTGKVNWYELKPGLFYPNAYHLVASLVYTLSGATIPATLNAGTVLMPGLTALSLVAVVRAFRGRAVVAGFTALVAVAATSVAYDNFWRGPLLPFTLGVALTPLLAVVMTRYLDRPSVVNGVLFGAAAVGMLAVHSSTLFGGILFVLPLFVQRWWKSWPTARRDVLLLLPAVVLSMLVTAPHLAGAISASSNLATQVWPVEFTVSRAVGSLLVFQHVIPFPQIWLAVGLWIGLLRFTRLGPLRWIGGSAVLFGILFVLTAAYPQPWIAKITSPWWNDRWRLVALATVPLCLIAGHGFGEAQRWLVGLTSRLRGGRVVGVTGAAVLAVVVLLVLTGLSKGLYITSNGREIAQGYGNAPNQNEHDLVVSADEVAAMEKLGTLVKPDQRVMNDRYDGSVWMYAIGGAKPVIGHYDASLRPPDVELLEGHFDDYDTDPAVRDAVRKLNIHYVLADTGYVRPWLHRADGMRDLDQKDFVRKVFQNQDAAIYELVPAPGDLP